MTSLTSSHVESPVRVGALWRIVNVAKLHVVNKGQIIVVPWMIMAFIFALMIAITGIVRMSLAPGDIADVNDGFQFSGGTTFIFIYMLVVAVMAINKSFPFAQGLNVTRRDFYFGSALAFIGLSAVYAAALTLLGWIEQITQGWGMNVTLFAPVYFPADTLERLYLFFLLFLFFFFVGAATASVYVRWALNGMLVFFASVITILVGAALLITLSNSWDAVGAWLSSSAVIALASWTLVPTALAAVAGYLLLRRATPHR